MKKLVLILITLVFAHIGFAQELQVTVTVTAPDQSKVTTDPKVFKTLENSIKEFMNNRKWTTETFKDYEKIEMSIFIGITNQQGDNAYTGTMTVITKRPAFNSDYNSTVLNIIDNDVAFVYKEYDPIEFNDNQFISNLSHILGFYAYLAIGADYDSFSEKGGQKYLQKAADVVALVGPTEAGSYPGWKSYEKNNRNRYWFITHMLNGRYEPYRLCMYQYHRLGLDNFYSDPVLARENMMKAIGELAKVSSDNPNLPLVMTWSESKMEEMIGAFSNASDEEKTTFIALMKKADPVNANLYEKVNESK